MRKRDDIASTDPSEISALRARVRKGALNEQDLLLLDRLLGTFLNLLSLIERKNASIKRLKRWLFGPGSDTRSSASGKTDEGSSDEPAQPSAPQEGAKLSPSSPASKPRQGHGRKASSAYPGAAVVRCTDPLLKPGSRCPDQACRGHLYDTNLPACLIQFRGQPLVGATRYEQQVLRCSACQVRFPAPLPQGCEPVKYLPSADLAVALAKYGAGLPFQRLSRLQQAFGTPLSESTLFERCEAVANAVFPIFVQLQKLAAQAELLYTDDTKVKILSCLKENKQRTERERRGLQTTAIVARLGSHQIALFASGRRHAGENLDELLRQREPGRPPPIQMGDALASNFSGEFETIVAKCLAHARRQFIDLEGAFPQECARVLDSLSEVYRWDAQTRAMSDDERLVFHQLRSGPVMEELRAWISQQIRERRVEPNSSLGKAMIYLTNHWGGLTRFLSVPGTPIDNNVVERALKRAVLHRKNALFYKTEHGAAVADILMSLIESSRLNGVSEWEYLMKLVSQPREVRLRPEAFLPWNYPREESPKRAA